jgi:hypothetical protein
MCRLRFFEINVKLGCATVHDFDILSFLMGSLCISLTSPATLEHLKFTIFFRGSSNNFRLHREEQFFEDLRSADAWTRLDSLTSHPTGSRLQRVDINIDYSFRHDDDASEPSEDGVLNDDDASEPSEDGVLNAVLDGLPLLRTKGILFVEAVSK